MKNSSLSKLNLSYRTFLYGKILKNIYTPSLIKTMFEMEEIYDQNAKVVDRQFKKQHCSRFTKVYCKTNLACTILLSISCDLKWKLFLSF